MVTASHVDMRFWNKRTATRRSSRYIVSLICILQNAIMTLTSDILDKIDLTVFNQFLDFKYVLLLPAYMYAYKHNIYIYIFILVKKYNFRLSWNRIQDKILVENWFMRCANTKKNELDKSRSEKNTLQQRSWTKNRG